MAEGSLERSTRRMDGFQIDGRQVFARNITNADLERKDEMDDELAELGLRHAKLVGVDRRTIARGAGENGEDEIIVEHDPGEVDECDDPGRRAEIRYEARALAKEIRRLDTLLVALYLEDEQGERFSDEVLLNVPLRVIRKLSVPATMYAFGAEDDEARPTTAGNASG